MKILSFDKDSKILRLTLGNKRKPVKKFLLVPSSFICYGSCSLSSKCKYNREMYSQSLCGILGRMFPESAELFSSYTSFNVILEKT